LSTLSRLLPCDAPSFPTRRSSDLRNGDVIEEDICLGVATSGGRRLVEQEPRTSVRSTLDHEEGLSFRQVICARGGGISARSSGVLHFFEQRSEERRVGKECSC